MKQQLRAATRWGLALVAGAGLVASCSTESRPLYMSLSCTNGDRNEAYPQSATVECLQFFETGTHTYVEPDNTHEVQFSLDGLHLFTSSTLIQEWDLATGEEAIHCPLPDWSDCHREDGGAIVFSNEDGYRGYIYDRELYLGPMYEEQSVVRSTVPPYSKEAFLASYDLFISYNDDLFHLYSATTGEFGTEVPVAGGIESMVGGRDSYSIATMNFEILNITALEGRESMLFEGHEAPIASMVYSDDDSRLVSLDAEGHLIVWDLSDGSKALDTTIVVDDMYLGGEIFSPGVDIAWSPDNQILAISALQSTVTFYSANNAEILAEIEFDAGVLDLDISPDGTKLAIGFVHTGVYNQNIVGRPGEEYDRTRIKAGPARVFDISLVG